MTHPNRPGSTDHPLSEVERWIVKDSSLSEIERWILGELSPVRSTTAELSYEHMESQSDRRLAVIYEPLDGAKRAHWHDVAIVNAFAHAVRDADVILDVGPGDGWPSLRIADRFAKVVGIDPSPRRVRAQRENAERLEIGNVEFRQMDVLSMEFGDETFGGVTAATSIEQTGDPRKALAEIFRVLKPGGVLAMSFEDYDGYFEDSAGDEELWSETADEQPVLFYQCRRKDPPREAKYGLFLDAHQLKGDGELSGIIEGLARDPAKLENLSNLDNAPTRPGELGLAFFQRLSEVVLETKYFELRHLTGAILDALLKERGFIDIRHFDPGFPELLAVFDGADAVGRIGGFVPAFVTMCELFGVGAVSRARPGSGSFVIAQKPKPGGAAPQGPGG